MEDSTKGINGGRETERMQAERGGGGRNIKSVWNPHHVNSRMPTAAWKKGCPDVEFEGEAGNTEHTCWGRQVGPG